MSFQVHNPRPEQDPEPESLWESIQIFFFERIWFPFMDWLRGNDDGPKGPRAA